jgi:hypothetical protein
VAGWIIVYMNALIHGRGREGREREGGKREGGREGGIQDSSNSR